MSLERSAWRDQIVRELQRAPHDRHHAWRTPVLASVSSGAVPKVRTVVLRAVAEEGAVLRIYTDARSGKVAELQQQPLAGLVFWSARLNLQLRVQAHAQVHVQGPLVEDAWSRMRLAPSAADYLSAQAPGSACRDAQGRAGEQALEVERGDPPHHLAVIECRAQTWDALLLSRQGHRRAAWCWDAHGRCDEGRWLVP